MMLATPNQGGIARFFKSGGVPRTRQEFKNESSRAHVEHAKRSTPLTHKVAVELRPTMQQPPGWALVLTARRQEGWGEETRRWLTRSC